MMVRHLKKCKQFVSGDGALLRELLNARKGSFAFGYSLAHCKLKKGLATSPHRLKTSEVYYIFEGRGRMHINSSVEKVGPGDTIYIPPKAVQFIENTGRSDLKFLCIVDPAWRVEDETVM